MSERPRSLTLQFLAEPTDVNFGGKVHGGAVMKWIDQAGFAAAVGWSGHYSVTVAVGGICFLAPVKISDLDVRARSPLGGDDRLCTHCIIAFVAVDRDTGATVEVPAWAPDNEEDRRLHEYAEQVMALSKGIEATVARYAPTKA